MNQEDQPVDRTDEADQQWIASIIPEGAMATAFIGIVGYVDNQGESRWAYHAPMETEFASMLGLLEAAKLAIVVKHWDILRGDRDAG